MEFEILIIVLLLYICKHNLQAAMDKENCGLVIHNSARVWVSYTEYTIYNMKIISQ